MHFDIVWQLARIPTHGKNFYRMSTLNQLARGTQHIALHAAKGKVFEYDKSKLHDLIRRFQYMKNVDCMRKCLKLCLNP